MPNRLKPSFLITLHKPEHKARYVKQFEAQKDWACFSFRSYFELARFGRKDTKQEVSVKIMAFQNAKTL